MKNNMVGWFEIPVKDMDRAIRFYETVFNVKIEKHEMGPLLMGWFPFVENGGGSMGSLVYNEKEYKPSKDGTLVYFTAHSGDAAVELGRVEKAGGKLLIPKKLIAPDIGYMGLFIDSEGNRIAVHSRN
jgi:predicted enzyme related to lactoylglutathione lyase